MSTARVARAPAVVGVGVTGAVVAGVLAGAASVGRYPLAGVLLAVQLLGCLAWLAFCGVPSIAAPVPVVVAAVVGIDLLAVRDRPFAVSSSVGVVAMAMVGAMVVELSRRDRQRVVVSLAGTISAVVVGLLGAHWVALVAAPSGDELAPLALASVAAGLLAGRVADRRLPRPALVIDAHRGLAGLVTAVGISALVGAGLAATTVQVDGATGALVGAAAAAAAAAADLAVDLATSELIGRRRAACRTLSALLPVLVAAPVAYAASRLLTT